MLIPVQLSRDHRMGKTMEASSLTTSDLHKKKKSPERMIPPWKNRTPSRRPTNLVRHRACTLSLKHGRYLLDWLKGNAATLGWQVHAADREDDMQGIWPIALFLEIAPKMQDALMIHPPRRRLALWTCVRWHGMGT
jgi:hypothetical protein